MKWKREKESNRRSRNIRERGREKWEEEERGVREGKPSLRNFTRNKKQETFNQFIPTCRGV